MYLYVVCCIVLNECLHDVCLLCVFVCTKFGVNIVVCCVWQPWLSVWMTVVLLCCFNWVFNWCGVLMCVVCVCIVNVWVDVVCDGVTALYTVKTDWNGWHIMVECCIQCVVVLVLVCGVVHVCDDVLFVTMCFFLLLFEWLLWFVGVVSCMQWLVVIT